MGKQILIYDNGQRYEMDSDLIYVPWFVGDKVRSVDVFEKEENKDETKISEQVS